MGIMPVATSSKKRDSPSPNNYPRPHLLSKSASGDAPPSCMGFSSPVRVSLEMLHPGLLGFWLTPFCQATTGLWVHGGDSMSCAEDNVSQHSSLSPALTSSPSPPTQCSLSLRVALLFNFREDHFCCKYTLQMSLQILHQCPTPTGENFVLIDMYVKEFGDLTGFHTTRPRRFKPDSCLSVFSMVWHWADFWTRILLPFSTSPIFY